MITQTHQAKIRGQILHRLILSPESSPQGGLVFFHGQGDFIDRYPPILEGFVNAGYRCILTDLPGHGRSPGKRGHVPGLDFIDALLTDSLTHLNGPVIIAGHSMGGLMALRLFLNHSELFQAAWFSSPLLKILNRTNPLLAFILPVVAKILPRLTISTGVTSEQCGDHRESGQPDEDALYHSRISLGWGNQLCQASDTVWEKFTTRPTQTPILFTQGDQDSICPPPILRELLNKPKSGQTTLELIEEARHEPFSGSTGEILLKKLDSWIEKISP